MTTSHAGYARAIRMMRDWGQEQRHHHVMQGFNYRMEGIQGAILSVKLRYLDEWTSARQAHAARYTRLFGELGVPVKPMTPADYQTRHIYEVL